MITKIYTSSRNSEIDMVIQKNWWISSWKYRCHILSRYIFRTIL